MTAQTLEDNALTFDKAKCQLSSYVEFINIEKAKHLLENNRKDNRKINMKVARSYADDYLKKRWKVTGEAIKIDDKGQTCDGQHRLTGLILANEIDPKFKGFEFLIISGVPSDSMSAMDDGYKRTLFNALEIAGKRRPHQQDIVRALYMLINLRDCALNGKHYEANRGGKRHSTTEIVELLDNLPHFDQVATKFFNIFDTKEIKRVMSVGAGLAMYYLYHDVDEERVFGIFKTFESGIPFDGLKTESPTYKAYRKTQRDKEMKIRKRPWEHVMLFTWTLAKCLEASKDQIPKELIWNWDTKNPIISAADKKLRSL